MRIYHERRDLNIPWKEQKAELMKKYKHVTYIASDSRTVTIFAAEWGHDDDEDVSDEME